MSPNTARRRRWLIVTCVVALSSVTWWYWPRGDARFVGSWTVNGSGARVTFGRNGLLLSVRGPKDRVVAAWRIEGDKLILGSDPPAWVNRGVAAIRPLWAKVFDFQIDCGSEEVYDITSVSRDVIDLREGGKNVTTLTRSSE